ncbi:Osmotically-inducible protein Y precursor [Candidatus Gullanella endobia]|uniref:Osmotically-inducible protein Y n=1 Tax=Candidatus Gullanella endobia TaxID=1070130 RepID=A0A143WR36_9ENTR|nr:division/outer membrane stress-associated lipid-binding lipoprotein [Candidatus Gullanella endobia]CUX96256.1 Osmotically-inducible protein Y precursor [Candidatus Gullanella endobia]
MKIYALLLLLFTTLILQGCVSAVVIGTAAFATKTATDPRTLGKQVDDNILEIRIKNMLSKNQKLKNTRISNITYQGKVLLIGQAPTLKLIKYAKQIVMSVNDVTEVYNEIRQSQPISLKHTFIDTWITTKIRFHFLISDIVKSSNIKISTENGEVFLLGIVTDVEGKTAAALSSKVNGVKHVITAFTYLQ